MKVLTRTKGMDMTQALENYLESKAESFVNKYLRKLCYSPPSATLFIHRSLLQRMDVVYYVKLAPMGQGEVPFRRI